MNTIKIPRIRSIIFQLMMSIGATFAAAAQELWMVLPEGGRDNVGTIAHYVPSSSNFRTDFNFTVPAPGARPSTGMTEANNKFYGVTTFGGDNNAGVLYEWDPASKRYTKLHDFIRATGTNPHGPLTPVGNKLYGTTSAGGADNSGAIFEWDLSTQTYSKKFDFYYSRGVTPLGAITYHNGKIYGVTRKGGNYNRGVLFEWDPVTATYTNRIDRTEEMGSIDDGAALALFDGKLYGATWGGGKNDGSIIFEWDPTTHAYTEKMEVEQIDGWLFGSTFTLYNGKFYGNTYAGGKYDLGVIWEWDPVANDYTKKIDLINFDGHQGFRTPLTFINGKAYGLLDGRGYYQKGILYEWDPLTNVIERTRFSSGRHPVGALTYKDGLLYGVTTYDGASDTGIIFAWDIATHKFTKLADFGGSILGSHPRGALIYMNDKFYGTTYSGGIYNSGVLFEWNPSTNVLRKRFDFSVKTGIKPIGALVNYNDKLYGAGESGGTWYDGTIFEWDPATGIMVKKADLHSISARGPTGLTYCEGKFYGVTTTDDDILAGVLFEWDPSTNALTGKVYFNNTLGRTPQGSLVNVNGHLYGVTKYGPGNSGGVVFEYVPATNSYINRLIFPRGYSPQGLTYANNKLYGVTESGGSNGAGIIFEWNVNSPSYLKRIDFTSDLGTHPKGPLTYSNGKFYGTTYSGGASNFGVFFEWDPATNQYKNLMDFDAATGGHPANTQILEVFNVAPPPVYVIRPAEGATGQKIRLDVIARPVKGASGYTIELSTSGDFSTGILRRSGDNKQRFDSLRYNTVYYARAKTNLDPRFGKVTTFRTISDCDIQGTCFTLVNASTNEDIQPLREGDIITKPANTNFNIRYNPVGTPGSVVFRHQDRIVRTENAIPFSLRGDYSGDYLEWGTGVPGMHKVEATPYSEPSGKGTPGPGAIVNFIIEEDSVGEQKNARASAAAASTHTDFDIFPNPSPSGVSMLVITGFNSKPGMNASITIRRMTGESVYVSQLRDDNDFQNDVITVRVRDLTTGVYVVTLTRDGSHYAKRLIVN